MLQSEVVNNKYNHIHARSVISRKKSCTCNFNWLNILLLSACKNYDNLEFQIKLYQENHYDKKKNFKFFKS